MPLVFFNESHSCAPHFLFDTRGGLCYVMGMTKKESGHATPSSAAGSPVVAHVVPGISSAPSVNLMVTAPVLNATKNVGHRWSKDNYPKSGGRPKGARDWSSELWDAIRTVESEPGRRPFIQHITVRAYENDPVAMKLLDKLLPNRTPDEKSSTPLIINVINLGAPFAE